MVKFISRIFKQKVDLIFCELLALIARNSSIQAENWAKNPFLGSWRDPN